MKNFFIKINTLPYPTLLIKPKKFLNSLCVCPWTMEDLPTCMTKKVVHICGRRH